MGEANYDTSVIPLVILCRHALVCDLKLSIVVVLNVEICCKCFLILLFYRIFMCASVPV